MRTLQFKWGFGLIAISVLGVMPVVALATVVENFDTPPDPAVWTLTGVPAYVPTWYEVPDGTGRVVLLLTDGDPGDPDQLSSIFWSELISADKFNVSFDFWIGQLTGGKGGEGMTFAWVREGSSLLGDGGSSLGFYGDGVDGYGVEFDTSPQPGRNHVAIVSSTAHSPDSNGFVAKEVPKDMENAVDAQGLPSLFHVDIVFDNGHLEMWMSSENAVPPMPETKMFDDDIPGYVPYDAYFGFTAAMSSSQLNVHAIDNIVINLTGAHAGNDRVVWSGDEVTLDGSRSLNATGYHWQQIEGTPTVTLDDPEPGDGISHFTAPDLTVGTRLTFKLTIDSPDGESSDTVTITVRANNAPAVAPSDLRIQRSDSGFRLQWDALIDADKYGVGRKFGDVFLWFWTETTYYDFKGLMEGDVVTVAVKAWNEVPGGGGGDGPLSEEVTVVVMPNVALAAGTTPPSASFDYDGSPVAGMNDGKYDDDNNSSGTAADVEDCWGYVWSEPLFFDGIVYFTGGVSWDGGWWTSLTVQYTEDGSIWNDAAILEMRPDYDFTNSGTGRESFARYDIVLPVLRGTGIRIHGTPGGVNTYTSIAELEVFGDQSRPQDGIIVQGIDAEVSEGSVVTLDGSYTFSLVGDIVSYEWRQESGPPVTIQNATSPIASFDAPMVDQDEVLVFSLTVEDSTAQTATDDDVRITVKNLVTTAVAGPDRQAVEGSEVILDGSASLTSTGTLTYLWRQTGGTTVGVTGSTDETVAFTAPAIWDYTEELTFELEVNDGAGGVSTDEVVIEVHNSLTAPVYDLEPRLIRHILHLGQPPYERIFVSQESDIDVDHLLKFGGQANITPGSGDAFDFSGTGIGTTSNPLIWTPEYSASGAFASLEELEEFAMYWHIYILSPDEREARLHYSNDDPIRAWNNGELVLTAPCCNTDAAVQFTLHEGVNSMTFKLVEWHGNNYFRAAITNLSDGYYTDLKYALAPAFLLTDAYAGRVLPLSYQPGESLDVELLLKVNPDSKPGSVSVVEQIPAGIDEADVNAPGATIQNREISWTLSGDQVKISTLSYSLSIPQGVTGALDFAGTVAFGATTTDVYGESVVYAVPSAPRYVEAEMLMAAHLSWSAPPEIGVTGYKVFRSEDGGAWQEIATVTGTSYTDMSVVAGVNYAYQVSAVNVRGSEGPASLPTEQASLPTMEVREAEDFNYGGGSYPYQRGVKVAAIEAPDASTIGTPQEYDFWHPNKGGDASTRVYRPNDNIGIHYDSATGYGAIGWVSPGSWWRYTFNVPEDGWIILTFRIATHPNREEATLAAYWDETLVGTVTFANNFIMTWEVMEDQVQTTAGEHTLRLQAVAEGTTDCFDFDTIAIGWNWSAPKRKTIWEDDFEDYADTSEVVSNGGWQIINHSQEPKAAWQLWNTAGPSMDGEDPNLAGMDSNYMITNSDMAGDVPMDEELISPEIDGVAWTKLRLDFNKNYRTYADPDPQNADVDIRVFDDVTGWSDWVTLFHLDTSSVPPGLDPPILSGPEELDLSSYDGKKIQLRFHYYDVEFDYWFAVDDIRVSGVQPTVRARVAQLSLVGDQLTLVWEPEGSYYIEHTTDLMGTWTELPGGPVTGTTAGVTIPGDRTGFYRLRAAQ